MSAQQPLHNLLPTTNPLPPRLVNLSASLLAQSRNRASNLKPEEEIARSYACAEIACKRLRAQLRLPPTAGRPPCKPAVYKKLLGFLEGVLGETNTSTTTLTTTPKKRTADGQPKTITLSAKTSASAKKQAFAGTIDENVSDTSASEAPEFVMPTIRKLCKTFATPLLPPHVYTGTCVVLKLSELWPPKRGSKGKARDEVTFRSPVMMVTIGVYFMVLSRMQKGRVSAESFVRRLGKALEVAELDTLPEEVEEWIKKMNAEGWCRGQGWWESVPEEVMEGEEVEVEEIPDDVEEDEVVASSSRRRLHLDDGTEEDPEDLLLPGLGTMMQDSVDWLSEERKLHFLDWKDGIMKRIRVMDKGKGRAVTVH
jgi:origin recognition complex subunit 6